MIGAAEKKPEGGGRPDLVFVAAQSDLTSFLDGLLAANRLFEKGNDGGRLGAIEALNAVWKFLHPIPGTHDHRQPIVALLNALTSLDEGDVLPLLAPAKRTGRHPASVARNCAKGMAVATAARLQEAGMGAGESYRRVAKICREAGFAPGRGRNPHVTERTLIGWKEEIEADPGRRSDAAMTFDRLKSLPPYLASEGGADMHRDLLEALRRSLMQMPAGAGDLPRPEDSGVPPG
jgi:hypothetical protein